MRKLWGIAQSSLRQLSFLVYVMLMMCFADTVLSVTDKADDDDVDSTAELSSAAEEEHDPVVAVEVPRIDDDEFSSFFITSASVPQHPDQQEKEEASIDTFNDIFIDSSDMYVVIMKRTAGI